MAKKKTTPPGLAKAAQKLADKLTAKVEAEQKLLKPKPYVKNMSVEKGQHVTHNGATYEAQKNFKKAPEPKENANYKLIKAAEAPEVVPYVDGMPTTKGWHYSDSGKVWESQKNFKKSSKPKANANWKFVGNAETVEEQPPVVVPKPVEPPKKDEDEQETEEPPKTEEPDVVEVPGDAEIPGGGVTPSPGETEQPGETENPDTEQPEPNPGPVVEEPPKNHPPTTPDITQPETPAPDPANPGQRITGNIFPYCRIFTNNAGKHNPEGLMDGDLMTGTWITDTERKPFGPTEVMVIVIPRHLEAIVKQLKLADGWGQSDFPMSISGVLNEGFEEVQNLAPDFYGKKAQAWHEHDIKEEHGDLFSIKITSLVNEDRNYISARPTEIEIIADYVAFEKPALRPKLRTKLKNLHGANWHHYYSAAASGRGLTRPDKLQVLKQSLKVVRIYLGMDECLYQGKFTFNPLIKGGWPMDDVLLWNTANGIHTIVCIRDRERSPEFLDFARNCSARWGKNKNIDPATLNVFTGPGYPANELVIGLGVDLSLQFINEGDGDWLEESKFIPPFEMAELQTKLYNISKSLNPDLPIVSNGFAKTRPGYIDGIGYWCWMHNNRRAPFDILAYHDYCSRNKDGQRTGNKSALPPELTNYYNNAQGFRECLEYWFPEQEIELMQGETGYSISKINPEMAVVPIGDWDELEVQSILHERTILESAAAGFKMLTTYHGYDTADYINSLIHGNGHAPWDCSMGIANRYPDDIYSHRPASYGNAQRLKFLSEHYLSKESDRTGEVFEHVLSADGGPDILAIVVPTYENKKVQYKVKYDLTGVKIVTLIECDFYSTHYKERDVQVNGSLTLEATEKYIFVRINPADYVTPVEAKEGGAYTLATRPEKAPEGTSITVSGLRTGKRQIMRSRWWINTGKKCIVETDAKGDSDDILGLAVAVALENLGLIEIALISLNTTHEKGPSAIDAFLRSRGRTDNLISIPKTPHAVSTAGLYYDSLIKLPHEANSQNCPDSVSMYRKILSESEHRVTIMSIGFLTNLEEFLKSCPDQYSSLTGRELAREKAELYIMGGKNPKGTEYNFNASARARAAAKYVAENWPGRVIYSGHEVGWQVWTGGNLLSLPDTDPLKKVLLEHGDFKEGETPGNHSWDPMLILQAAIGSTSETEVDLYAAGYSVVRGTNKIAANGSNVFEPNDTGNHYYTVRGLDKADYAREINSFLIQGQEPEKVFIKEKP